MTIFDDELVEDQEFFTIALGSSDEAIFFTTQFAVVTIESNDGEPRLGAVLLYSVGFITCSCIHEK